MVRHQAFLQLGTTISGTDTEPSLHCPVLDLPQLYTRPPATELLSTLKRLTVKLSSWNFTENWQEHEGGEIGEDGVPKYLTGIISSPLLWIEDENLKEQIWEAAGARLSERSGRTGELDSGSTTPRSKDIQLFHVTYSETYSYPFRISDLQHPKSSIAANNNHRPTNFNYPS